MKVFSFTHRMGAKICLMGQMTLTPPSLECLSVPAMSNQYSEFEGTSLVPKIEGDNPKFTNGF